MTQQMRTVLVTGAHGFLGRHCAREFSRHGYRVIGLGYGTWRDESPEQFGIRRWIEAAVDLGSLREIGEPVDIIAHCAGSGSVGYSLTNPMQDFQMTVDTTLAVLEFMHVAAPGAKLVYPSSAAVYGCRDDAPIRETDTLQPLSPYGAHKMIAEELCFSYARNFGLKVSVIRFFSLYGAGLTKQLLWEACRRFAATSHGEVEFFGSGEETRDWLHVRDAAALVRVTGEADITGLVVNGGSGIGVPVREILGMVADGFDGGVKVAFNGETREGDPKYLCADITRAHGLGWAPRAGLREGVGEYVAWFKRNIEK